MAEMNCPQCGVLLEKGVSVCPECGAQIPAQAGENPYRPAYASPLYDAPPPRNSRFSPLSTGAFLLNMLVMSIPLIGLIVAIVWACGGCKKRNRRNQARAWLILLLIGIVLAAGAYFLLPLLGISVEMIDPSAWSLPQWTLPQL